MFKFKKGQGINRSHRRIKNFLTGLIIFFTLVIGGLGLAVVGIIKDAPDIDMANVSDQLKQTSTIVNQDGEIIENVQTSEYRELISLDKIPQQLTDAFVAVEDERFYSHSGVDPLGVMRAVVDNLKAGSIVQGASTIAQQLARNLYLSTDQNFDRKIKEAYLALQLTEALGQDGVLEAYMNRVYLGQNAYGVQAASKIYFSKDIDEITLAEAATLAGIVKSPTNLALYRTKSPGDVSDEDTVVGEVRLNGHNYTAILNNNTLERQKYVLSKMLETGKIDHAQFEQASAEDIASSIDPGRQSEKILSAYYSDLIQSQVTSKLVQEGGYTEEEAKNMLVNGGIKIYSSVDMDLQKEIEEIYNNFSSYILRGRGSSSRPALLNYSADGNGNITNANNEVIYFQRSQMINSQGRVVIPSSQFEITEDGGVLFKTNRLRLNGNQLDIVDYYSVNNNNNLVTHEVSKITIPNGQITQTDEGLKLDRNYIKNNEDFYTINTEGNMVLNDAYYIVNTEGVPQPQASTVIIDHKNGAIKAVVGGRSSQDEQQGYNIYNRATKIPRQPGSTMKPLAVYTPALANGYTAASGIDDVPFYNNEGERWPNNRYNGYKGIVSLRESVEQSINVNAVKTLEAVTIPKSKEFLTNFGIINPNNMNADHFVTADENPTVNDENLAMALGAMTEGLTNLELTAAYAALANEGTYVEPLTFTKVEDSKGNVLLDHPQKRVQVVSPQTAFVMTDILRTSVNYNYAVSAKHHSIQVAGKTGTTQGNQDLWFVGYSPYYTIGTWMGFDNQQLKLSYNGGEAVDFWGIINDAALANKEAMDFREPNGIVRKQVCTLSGKLPKQSCYNDPRGVVKTEVFAAGTEPTEYCHVHEGQWGNSYIVRPVPYDPAKNGYIYPDDWRYTKEGRAYYQRQQQQRRWNEQRNNQRRQERETDDEDENENNNENNQNNNNQNNQNNQDWNNQNNNNDNNSTNNNSNRGNNSNSGNNSNTRNNSNNRNND